MKFSTQTRSTIGVVAVALVSVVMIGLTLAGVGAPPVIEKPKFQLEDLPQEIGPWRGQSVALSEQEYEVLDAIDVASLRFSDDLGRVAYVHAAVWNNPEYVAETCPHHPEVCYRNTGWKLVGKQTAELEVDGVDSLPVQFTLMQQGDQRVVLGFTYEVGDQHYITDSGARLVQLELLGRPTWPVVTKYLVQTSAASIEDARPVIEPLLGGMIEWHAKTVREAGLDRSNPRVAQIGAMPPLEGREAP
ncbi:EpsI family protein [Roseiconus nitratireducens]|uniref:EpsI family protein n=1 Tax=Roseiconus nitratireducens TaxID=2605748 RepID=A0A5M6DJ60_9BACT|nr:exosortase C-terminal domain/associated protein EpsI [Roseiconus nitratireducens]KAA5546249.1 EpsI family protein [Roseiconus nitratireducens]